MYFSDPSETTSGFFEQKFEFEVREDGCFYVTLNSYNSFWNQSSSFQDREKTWCQWYEISTHSSIENWFDAMEIHNSDGFDSFRERYNDMRPELKFTNANYNPNLEFGFYLRSLEINNSTYNEDDIFSYPDGGTVTCNYNGYNFQTRLL